MADEWKEMVIIWRTCGQSLWAMAYESVFLDIMIDMIGLEPQRIEKTQKYRLGEKIFRYCNFECRLV